MAVKFAVADFRKIGKVVKQSDVYTVTDVSKLDNLVVSKTVLHPGKETGGHSHGGAEEVYFFMEGKGKMQLDEEKFNVNAKDIVLIPKGSFHKVFNNSKSDLVFVCVFEKYGERK
jgi:mannose-6-phosphate isomerase-like protein (cupin superfamily)